MKERITLLQVPTAEHHHERITGLPTPTLTRDDNRVSELCRWLYRATGLQQKPLGTAAHPRFRAATHIERIDVDDNLGRQWLEARACQREGAHAAPDLRQLQSVRLPPPRWRLQPAIHVCGEPAIGLQGTVLRGTAHVASVAGVGGSVFGAGASAVRATVRGRLRLPCGQSRGRGRDKDGDDDFAKIFRAWASPVYDGPKLALQLLHAAARLWQGPRPRQGKQHSGRDCMQRCCGAVVVAQP